MLDRVPTDFSAESSLGASGAWKAFVRSAFRFLCAASLLAAVEIYRRGTGKILPIDRRVVGAILAFGSAGLLGILILWRSRDGVAREVLESAAMIGFWTGFFALFV